jgi:DNA-binding transcriptional regulator YiaG
MDALQTKVGRWSTNVTAQAIRSIRLNLQENQSEFAARFSVRQNAVSRWETGRVVPTPGNLMSLLRLATGSEQKQGIINALDAAGISIDQVEHTPKPVSSNLQGEGNV